MLKKTLLFALASLTFLTPMAVKADELVANGGFETGDFTGWTQSGNTGYTGVGIGAPHSGDYSAYLGPVGSDGYLSETLSTVAGNQYQITFWLNSDGQTPNDFTATFDNSTLSAQSDMPADCWTEYSYTALASTDSTLLQFAFRNDPGYLGLDDVSVSTIATAPEPVSESLTVLGGLALVLARLKRRKSI